MHEPLAGYNDVADDAAMGWARYAHSMRVFVFNSGLFYIRPTPAALDLLDRIALRLAAENGWDQAIFNEVRAACCWPALAWQATKSVRRALLARSGLAGHQKGAPSAACPL